MFDLAGDLACGAIIGALFWALGAVPGLAPPRTGRVVILINRFEVGFAFGALNPAVAAWLGGVLAGLLLALTEALRARRWALVLGLGAIGLVVLWLILNAEWGMRNAE